MVRKFITYPVFDAHKEIRAFTTTRQTIEGTTAPRFTGQYNRESFQNKMKLAKVLGLDENQLIFPNQTHSNSVERLTKIPISELNGTDALITNQPGICLCIQTADCVPVLLYNPVHKVIAAVHAGWRGTVSMIVKKTVMEMAKLFSILPNDIMAVIGPSIGPESYEVGEEVIKAVISSIPNAENSIKKQENGKFLLNLWEANKQILIDCGVSLGNIEISGHCTYTGSDRFFSARRDGIETGRLVSGIMLLADPQFK